MILLQLLLELAVHQKVQLGDLVRAVLGTTANNRGVNTRTPRFKDPLQLHAWKTHFEKSTSIHHIIETFGFQLFPPSNYSSHSFPGLVAKFGLVHKHLIKLTPHSLLPHCFITVFRCQYCSFNMDMGYLFGGYVVVLLRYIFRGSPLLPCGGCCQMAKI